MVKVYIFDENNNVSRVNICTEFFQCVNLEISLTHCAEINAVC